MNFKDIINGPMYQPPEDPELVKAREVFARSSMDVSEDLGPDIYGVLPEHFSNSSTNNLPDLSAPGALEKWAEDIKHWGAEMKAVYAEQKQRLVQWVCVPIYREQAIPISVRQLDVVTWASGKNMPSMLYDFERWWVATLIKHRLVQAYYLVKMTDLTDPMRMPITPIEFPGSDKRMNLEFKPSWRK
jgi:hypothetical protein